jgi:hypothetical protein
VEEGVEVEVAAPSCVGVSSSSTHSKVEEVEVAEAGVGVGVQAWQLQVLLHSLAVLAAALAVLSRPRLQCWRSGT